MDNSSIPEPTGIIPTPSPTSAHATESGDEPTPHRENKSDAADNTSSEETTDSTEKYNLFDIPPALIIACSAAFGIAGPFVLWAIWKDKSEEIRKTAKSVLNTQLSWHLWIILSCSLLPIHSSLSIITLAAVIGWGYITAKQIIEFSNKNYEYTPPLSITLF